MLPETGRFLYQIGLCAGAAGAVLAGTLGAAARLGRLARTGGRVRTTPPPVAGALESLGRARERSEARLDAHNAQYELALCLRGDQDPESLADAVLGFALPTMRAQAGVFHLARPGQRLVLAARYGLAAAQEPHDELRLGQGLIGRTAAGARPRLLVGAGETGLLLPALDGACEPAAVFVMPFHLDGRLKGVLTAAWADAEDAAEPDFLVESAESVATALDSAHARVRVARLLEATRSQAVMLARQQRELQQTNEELARADRCKTEFLANMSHELRTPLNSMLIMSQVLAENRHGNLTGDEVETALTINRAGNELLLIINDILDMSRVEAGRVDIQPASVPIRQVIADLQDLFRPVAERQGLQLRTSVAKELPPDMVSDPLRLSQILKNLLNNAFKFTEQGEVRLDVREAAEHEKPAAATGAGWLAFAVSDTGIGMSPQTLARISEPFFQGDGSIARRYGGSGLGLSISWRLAGLLGGGLTATSVEGEGSTFVLAVPAALAAVPAAAEPAMKDPASDDGVSLEPWAGRLAGRSVLLADTDMRAVFEVSRVLDGLGARVTIVRTAGDAVRTMAAETFGLLCLAPDLFTGHEDDLRRVRGEAADGGPGCLWLASPPPLLTAPADLVAPAGRADAGALARMCCELTAGTALAGAAALKG